ncbi:MAG: GNAT family N-acetyltransferase [Chloroflexota bacterium]|nr:GNAT family N-acetyltransferase [Chloroflexota bacterium]
MNTANTFIYRYFDVQHDFAPLVALLNDVEQTDHDGEDVSEATLHGQLTWTGHNPALDRWVATLPGSSALIGYGTIFKSPEDSSADLYIAVQPVWRRQGIGSELLTRLLTRAREVGVHDVRVYATIQHQGARAFLTNHSFDPLATYTRMTVPGAHVFPLPDVPEGFVIRSYEQLQRLDLLTEAVNKGYEGMWGHHQVSQEEVATWLPLLPPQGTFLLFAPDGAVVGTCRAEMSEHLTMLRGALTGLVDAPGVIPAYREVGLQQSLVLTALHWLVLQSPATVELESWGDTADTLVLYRALGFTPMQEAISYRRPLS